MAIWHSIKVIRDTGNEIYTLRSSYDSGTDVDYFWRNESDRYFKADSDFYIQDNSDNREYNIGNNPGKVIISDFNFGVNGDEIRLNSVEGLGVGNNDVYITDGNGNAQVKLSTSKILTIIFMLLNSARN